MRYMWMKTLLVAFLAVILAYGLAYSHTDLTPAEVKAFLDTAATVIVVDVREDYEFCDSTYSPPGHIPGALNMPWNSGYLQTHYGDLPADENTVIVCRSGSRSNSAANFLDGVGFTSVFDMTGGMNQWVWETELCASAGAPGATDGVPGSLALGSASPNPFTRATEISFAIPAGGPGEAELGIYDARGRLVRHSVLSGQRPGAAGVVWDGTDSEGRPVTSGLYFYRLTWNGQGLTRRVVLLR
jgi:rhodanese-related sulfurtransferase